MRQLGTQLDHRPQSYQRLLRRVLRHTSGYRLPLQDQVRPLLYRCEKDLANQNVTYNKIAGRYTLQVLQFVVWYEQFTTLTIKKVFVLKHS